jgi:hypothetical protein
MGNQPSHGGSAGLVRAEHLSQEHPERHEWREDSVVPACANRRECLRDDFRREHVRERRASVLKKLLSQKTDLPLNPSLGRMPHPWASLPVMGLLPNPIYAIEALLPVSIRLNVIREMYETKKKIDLFAWGRKNQ